MYSTYMSTSWWYCHSGAVVKEFLAFSLNACDITQYLWQLSLMKTALGCRNIWLNFCHLQASVATNQICLAAQTFRLLWPAYMYLFSPFLCNLQPAGPTLTIFPHRALMTCSCDNPVTSGGPSDDTLSWRDNPVSHCDYNGVYKITPPIACSFLLIAFYL